MSAGYLWVSAVDLGKSYRLLNYLPFVFLLGNFLEFRSAHNEAMIALDFISLMVSLNNPELGFTTMSPGLKEVVPLGSMGIEKVHTKYPPALTQEEKLVCQGWKLEGLNSAADSMMNAAKRLKVETEKETRYWKQILSIRDEGWTICKLPRERNTLGVRYGFAEGTEIHEFAFEHPETDIIFVRI